MDVLENHVPFDNVLQRDRFAGIVDFKQYAHSLRDGLRRRRFTPADRIRPFLVVADGDPVGQRDDRIVFETPGHLPGLVRPENIRHTHFSRNPKIALFMKAYKLVKEFGEGVDRICSELEKTGTPILTFTFYPNSFILLTTIHEEVFPDAGKTPGGLIDIQTIDGKGQSAQTGGQSASQSASSQQVVSKSSESWQQVVSKYSLSSILTWDKVEPILQQMTTPRLLKEIISALGYNDPHYFKKTFINPLITANIITMTIPDKPTSSSQKYVLTNEGKAILDNQD